MFSHSEMQMCGELRGDEMDRHRRAMRMFDSWLRRIQDRCPHDPLCVRNNLDGTQQCEQCLAEWINDSSPCGLESPNTVAAALTIDPGSMGGRACLAGTRITVSQVFA